MADKPETTPPKEAEKFFNWRGFVLWPLVILLLYALSFGPVEMLIAGEHFSPNAENRIRMFYRPLIWFCRVTPFGKPFEMYMRWWVPETFN